MCGRREGEGPSHAWPEMRTTGRRHGCSWSGWGLPCRLTRGSREVAGGKEKKRKLAEERAGKKEMREL